MDKTFRPEFSETTQRFTATMGGDAPGFAAKFDRVVVATEYVGGELYQGDYAVTPKVGAQTMPTKGKVMGADVTVLAIPIYETSNNSGGNTVYIAKEF